MNRKRVAFTVPVDVSPVCRRLRLILGPGDSAKYRVCGELPKCLSVPSA